MGIRQLCCPECGADVRMGIPRESTVHEISATELSESETPARKVRTVACPNEHEFSVVFSM